MGWLKGAWLYRWDWLGSGMANGTEDSRWAEVGSTPSVAGPVLSLSCQGIGWTWVVVGVCGLPMQGMDARYRYTLDSTSSNHSTHTHLWNERWWGISSQQRGNRAALCLAGPLRLGAAALGVWWVPPNGHGPSARRACVAVLVVWWRPLAPPIPGLRMDW